MKNLILCIVTLLGFALAAIAADATAKKDKLRHVVAFKFKESASLEQIKQVEEAFHALKSKISQIVSIESGTNISTEKFDKGFTHAFIVTFKSEKDRDAYLVHPEHKKFVEFALPWVADVFVIDFWGRK
jgi:hypothetical protein